MFSGVSVNVITLLYYRSNRIYCSVKSVPRWFCACICQLYIYIYIFFAPNSRKFLGKCNTNTINLRTDFIGFPIDTYMYVEYSITPLYIHIYMNKLLNIWLPSPLSVTLIMCEPISPAHTVTKHFLLRRHLIYI